MNVMEKERLLLNATNVVGMVSSDAVNVTVMVMLCAMNVTDVEESNVHGATVLEETACASTAQDMDMIQMIGNAFSAMALVNQSASPVTAMDMKTVANAMEKDT